MMRVKETVFYWKSILQLRCCLCEWLFVASGTHPVFLQLRLKLVSDTAPRGHPYPCARHIWCPARLLPEGNTWSLGKTRKCVFASAAWMGNDFSYFLQAGKERLVSCSLGETWFGAGLRQAFQQHVLLEPAAVGAVGQVTHSRSGCPASRRAPRQRGYLQHLLFEGGGTSPESMVRTCLVRGCWPPYLLAASPRLKRGRGAALGGRAGRAARLRDGEAAARWRRRPLRDGGAARAVGQAGPWGEGAAALLGLAAALLGSRCR